MNGKPSVKAKPSLQDSITVAGIYKICFSLYYEFGEKSQAQSKTPE